MFKNKVKQSIDPSTTDTLIGEGSCFEGNLTSQATIRIEGQMKGDIQCEGDVIIGENGDVHSNIRARNLIVAGKLTGDAHAAELLKITSKGQIFGNVRCKSIVIEEGGTFSGSSDMAALGTDVSSQISQDTPVVSNPEQQAAGL
ncbi:bactofilin family protein [Marinicrinis lubricantis]|uniref:Polymer-forming cytoskeletal protein n=1 Tax=Marinicrinis lubricantis TaxID=2086470 RepID=A0ABW1IRB8_9BACL